MEGQNILYGGVDELRQIKGALEAQADIRMQIENELQGKQNLEKNIEDEEKSLRKKIDDTIASRRKDIVDKFDGEIKKVQERLKGVRSDRKRAKNKCIADRITEETAELVQDNKNLRDEIKTVFTQKGVSPMWNIEPVYMLYYPKTLVERSTFLLIVLLALIGIPTLVVSFSHAHWLIRVLEYIIIVIIFVALYLVGYSFAKVRKGQAFEESAEQRNKMLKNQAEIKRIKRAIKKDKSEEKYNLGEFDSDIQELEAHIDDIVQKKNEAISDFEKNTKVEIEEEITARDIGKIEEMKKSLIETNNRVKELEEKQKNITIDISKNYTAYLGEENMNNGSIDKMIIILSENQANTIGEAINILKNKNL